VEDSGLHLLLDQGLPRSAAEQLRTGGTNCIHVGEIGLPSTTDVEILDWARVRGAIVVTLDTDFHTILAVQNSSRPSVIRLRLQGLNGVAVAKLVSQILEQYKAELEAGCMITSKLRKTTCRLLPKAD
jgi:predicted nuclease of predicted toxin-antitoxin system